MKTSRGPVENGIIVGNCFDKYGSRNPIIRLIMKRFETSLHVLVDKVKPDNIHEVGCGEGYWVINWHKQGIRAKGSDISEKIIAMAKDNAEKQAVPATIFSRKSIYNLSPASDSAELIVCCEVLEHLEKPEDALAVLSNIANPYLIVSVPREPVWRILNMMRGKYVTCFGNTPGHIQHWSKGEIISLVSQYFEVLDDQSPFPWTMLLCQRRAF